jgi:hypothetical protein
MDQSTPLPLAIEPFVDWLCIHEHEVIGTPGTYFNAPLSHYLQEIYGHVYGVQECKYGRACLSETQWSWLPSWAQAFVARAERSAFREMTGEQAFNILVEIVTV